MSKKLIKETLEENKIVSVVKEKKDENVETFVYDNFITIGFRKEQAFVHHKSSLVDMLYSMNLLQDIVQKTLKLMPDDEREKFIKNMDALSEKINEDGGIKTEKVENKNEVE